jgi:hypothetical protein
MLRVYHSNHLDVLEALMEFIVERDHLSDPFEPEVVLVQSTGMAQWLQMTLAQKFGIAANIDFPLPASFIWDMFVRVLPDIPKESAFTKQSMSWKLMSLLPAMLEQDEFAMLRHYLSDDDDKRKLFQLSSRIADLFDQYLVYRPEWLTLWEAGKKWMALMKRKSGRRRYGVVWWSIRPSLASRTGIVPIFISALSMCLSQLSSARQGYRLAYLSVAFQRCRQSICRRYRRWVSISMYTCSLPTLVATTGAILKTRHF